MKEKQVVSYDMFIGKLDMGGIPIKRHQLISLFLYKNTLINLSAIREPILVYKKHILDSIKLLDILKVDNLKVCDLWTWGGFPLLPLATICKGADFLWVDSVKKKLLAIQDIANSIWLDNIKVYHSRIEGLDRYVYPYDIYLARAVGYIDKLFNWTKNILKKWNKLVLYKLYTEQEYYDMMSLVSSYHLSLSDELHYDLWDEVKRVIYILEKY